MLSDDSALCDPSSDLLGYAPFAQKIAAGLAEADALDGLVVALYGRWGAGKSSLLSFIRHYTKEMAKEEIQILEFNPWWFSGAEELAENFFAELNRVVAPIKEASGALKTLWAYTSPLLRVGSSLAKFYLPEKAAALVEKGVDVITPDLTKQLGRETSFADAKQKLVDCLRAQKYSKRLIFIDDIDRLSSQETIQLFRLIKNVANLPNTIYVLAFDREIVAAALSGHSGMDGDAYLEKIVQVAFELPSPEEDALTDMLWMRLDKIIECTPPDLARSQDLRTMYWSGVNKIITKPRDVMRLANTLCITYPAVRGEVNAADFIALEALRLFCPGLYSLMRENPSMFLGSNLWSPHQLMTAKEFHTSWRSRADLPQAAVGITSYLFPQTSGVLENSRSFPGPWDESARRRLRICFADLLPVYFRFGLGNRSISSEALKNLMKQSEDESLYVREIDRMVELDSESGGSRAHSLIKRTLDQEFSPVFAHAFFRALLIRSNTLMSETRSSTRWIVPIYREALGRLVREGGKLRAEVDAALGLGQLCGVMHLFWMAGNPEEQDKTKVSDDDKAWLQGQIVGWLAKASTSELFSLPGDYLREALCLWATARSWDEVRAKFHDVLTDQLALMGLVTSLHVDDTLRSIQTFGKSQYAELFRQLFESKSTRDALVALAHMEPPNAACSEDAAKLLAFIDQNDTGSL